MSATVHELDWYSFNSGQNDIASGASDNENGRFETLGWAKSFNTTGEAEFETTWSMGTIDTDGNVMQGSESTRDDRYS